MKNKEPTPKELLKNWPRDKLGRYKKLQLGQIGFDDFCAYRTFAIRTIKGQTAAWQECISPKKGFKRFSKDGWLKPVGKIERFVFVENMAPWRASLGPDSECPFEMVHPRYFKIPVERNKD
jgi:hypothetical protein